MMQTLLTFLQKLTLRLIPQIGWMKIQKYRFRWVFSRLRADCARMLNVSHGVAGFLYHLAHFQDGSVTYLVTYLLFSSGRVLQPMGKAELVRLAGVLKGERNQLYMVANFSHVQDLTSFP